MEAEVFDAAGMAVKITKENNGATRENFRNSLLSTKGYPGDIGRISFTAQPEMPIRRLLYRQLGTEKLFK